MSEASRSAKNALLPASSRRDENGKSAIFEGGHGMFSTASLLIAPLAVWLGVFVYLVILDARVRKLDR